MNLSRDEKIGVGVVALLLLIGAYAAWVSAGVGGLIAVQSILIFLLIVAQLSTGRRMRKELLHRYQHIESLFSIFAVLKIDKPLPDLGGYAIMPTVAKSLISLLTEKKPETVVEFGSGTSTLIVAYCLKAIGRGKIISIDHDAYYAKRTADMIDQHGLSDFVQIVHAPLAPTEIDGERWLWYDQAAMQLPPSIDLVLVDGPPRKVQKHSRFPALPIVYDRLSRNAAVVLDDTGRQDEQEIARRWQRKFPRVEIETLFSHHDVIVLTAVRD